VDCATRAEFAYAAHREKAVVMARIIAVIPARMGSSRFPGKPLARINGVPMLGHVYFRSRMSPLLQEVFIATCDAEIGAYAKRIGAPCIRTAPTHERATDRTAEAVAILDRQAGTRADVVVMIQGDEPMLHPDMIDEAVASLKQEPSIRVVNLMAPVSTDAEWHDPNTIKVVVDRRGDALYFSRAPIPFAKAQVDSASRFKQVCIMPFRREFLSQFTALAPTALEAAESIDMLRALEHGYRVRMVLTSRETHSVDTPADLALVERHLAADPLVDRYRSLRHADRSAAGTFA